MTYDPTNDDPFVAIEFIPAIRRYKLTRRFGAVVECDFHQIPHVYLRKLCYMDRRDKEIDHIWDKAIEARPVLDVKQADRFCPSEIQYLQSLEPGQFVKFVESRYSRPKK